MRRKCMLAVTWIFFLLPAYAQNLAINADGSKANPNAILDIKSGNKGLLIPRMNSAARQLIPNTKGLLVYDSTTNSFWYNTGTQWQNMSASPLAAVGPWLLTGNAGTDSANFLGTTDNVPLNIRVNNISSGRIDHLNNNAFWGYSAGAINTTGNRNTGIGQEALAGNTTGARNTALGMRSLLNNSTGNENTATGTEALLSNTSGMGNTATGVSALRFNQGGFDNTAVGVTALCVLNGGNDNTAIGARALFSNTGNYNTASGSYSMWLSSTGHGNVAMGYFAQPYNYTGNNNTAIGYRSMYGIHDGSNNTTLGAEADIQGDQNNATAIGAGAVADASNKVRIGNSAVTVIEGQVPFTTPSDGRFKFNIQDDVKGLDFIMKLRPVTYQFDVQRFDAGSGPQQPSMQAAYQEASQIRRTGFIAQEVEQAALATGYNFSGIIKPKTDKEHYSLGYDAFVVPLVKALQEQQQLIADLQQQLNELKKQIQTSK